MTLFLYIISVTLIILFPPGLAVAFRRRFIAPWWLFVLGMVTFVASQLVHFPLNQWLGDLGLIGPVNLADTHLPRTALILGLSAGFSESVARAAGFWLLFRRRSSARWEDGVMVGLGHGGIEAMGLIAILIAATLSSLWGLRGTDLVTLNLEPDQLAQVSTQLEALETATWQAFLPLAERVVAVGAHVTFSVLVWLAFSRRNPLYWVTAVAYHSALDFSAVYLPLLLEDANWSPLILLLVMLPGLVWLWRSRPQGARKRPATMALAKDLKLFRSALRKELQQQWRSKRVLVVFAVFVLFGLGSPLLAKYTPQMLTMVEGAEQFADLIPVATTADSLNQYIRNLTQFGFIIAILLGMSAVAGEKEKGQAAMILSKPLPRWAYLLSKFTAQAVVYAGAFLAAALGAHYYTLLLFTPLAIGPFLCGNVLLLVWMLTFTAVTLLGSTVAQTVGQAAGIALVGSVLLLLAGSLPQVGVFAPSGLISWASQLGVGNDVSPNGGALVANIVLILVLLIASVAVFEGQEL